MPRLVSKEESYLLGNVVLAQAPLSLESYFSSQISSSGATLEVCAAMNGRRYSANNEAIAFYVSIWSANIVEYLLYTSAQNLFLAL